MGALAEGLSRLERIEVALDEFRQQQTIREHYSTTEFAAAVGRAEFTVRVWCRLGRINATKKASGHGRAFEWVIAHEELLCYRWDGLLLLES